MIRRPVNGLVSLFLIICAGVIGIIAILIIVILADGLITALAYLVLSLAGSLIILYSFCTKCPDRFNSGGHVFCGPLTLFLPERKDDPYISADIAGLIGAVLMIIGAPLYWLIRTPAFLARYVIILVAAISDIYLKVCPGCNNSWCQVKQSRP